jgi:hypothetical protein
MSFASISDSCHYDTNGTIMLKNDLLPKEEEKFIPYYIKRH